MEDKTELKITVELTNNQVKDAEARGAFEPVVRR